MAIRPNILFLFSDQHNARVLGAYGDRQVHTPVLDRLAAEGVLCTSAFTQNPICTPSRMCYLSGQYAHNHGNYGLEGPVPPLPSLFSHFHAQGYRTGMMGKIHTPAGWLSAHCDVVRDGYGHEYRTAAEGRPPISGDLQGGDGDDYSPYLAAKGLLQHRDDKYLQEIFAQYGSSRGQGVDARPSRLGADDTIEAWSAAQAIDFINQSADEDRPFCCWMTVPRPHETYVPAQAFWDLYDEDALDLPPSADDTLLERHISMRLTKEAQMCGDWTLFEPKNYLAARRRVLHGYYACVSQVDDACGRVLNALEARGLRENTIVVYATDHGEFAGEHGIIEKAPGISSRAVTRIPYIWSWPGHLREGARCEELVETVDFLPTVCALAGLPMPDWVDGHDISALLNGSGTPVRDIAVTENACTRAVHTQRYTLVHYPPRMRGGEDFGELFDHDDDPWERTNRYFDASYRPIVEDLRKRLLDWLIETTRWTAATPHNWSNDPADYSLDGKAPRAVREAILSLAPNNNYL